ncbi:MAG TPA: ATP-binding cassette domain-containing protein [Dehalococcoidia bacterium]|nr:ATP-binding cassette domain-containing protein [Dehalococcoidia bacterium]
MKGAIAAVAEVGNIVKTYGNRSVVNDISFSVSLGEIFGLIGPNGAGKTTTIRMMMDIVKPDSGEIRILGEKLDEDTKDKIGYLPEERGLYKKLTVTETLNYLSALKGRQPDNIRTEELLKRVGMLLHKKKKIEELSRGMGQLIQFLATIIHDPQLVILDEPFAGLDPVNTELLKEIILELRGQGKSIIFSTHQMNQVEELCDRILMINHGRSVLYGKLVDIKNKYRNNSVLVDAEGELGELDSVVNIQKIGKYTELFLDDRTPPQKVLEQIINKGIVVNRFEVTTPSLNQIFIRVAGESSE